LPEKEHALKSKTLVLAVILLAIAAGVGCGSSGSVILPPNGGNYSNASLKGSYVYEVHGFDFNFNPFRQVGVFTADGNGNITGGSDDSSVSANGSQVAGTYTVAKDGTGFITISTSLGTVNWAITLTSASEVQLIEADSDLNARGTAQLQPPSAIAATLSGTYVFRLHQEVSAPNAPSLVPAAEVGSLTISNGSATGAMDETVFGSAATATNITATFNAPSGLGRGTGTLVDSSTSFTTDFVYYIVDIKKFLMLVTNAGAVGSGAAELQSGNVGNGLSGTFAFGSRGDDGTTFAGIATVGQFSASAGSLSGSEDLSQDGTSSSNVAIASCYSASANGRVVVTDASGGTCSSTVTQVFWMVSPARAFFVNSDSNTVEDGSADLQTSQNFALSTFTQQYSMAMDGVDLNPELFSRVGVLQFDGKGNVKVNEVINASASGSGVNNPGILAGTYTVASNGRIVSTIDGGSLNLVMYAISASQAYVLQSDSGITTSGQVLLQQ
jgi:hypothetical protein